MPIAVVAHTLNALVPIFEQTRERAIRVFGIELPADAQHWSFVTVAELIHRWNARSTHSRRGSPWVCGWP
jgi:hypothetical protein